MPPPTILDVARASHVSPSTVSLVISDHPRIPLSTKEKVRKKILELNYRPNILARSLANGHTRILAVLIPPVENVFSDPFYVQALDGIYSVARQKGYRIILEVATQSFWTNGEHERLARERLCEGIIFVGGVSDEHKKLAALADEEGLPVSVVGETPPRRFSKKIKMSGVYFVSGDNFKGGYIATKYLIDSGHRRIAHIYGNPSVNSVMERLAGYRRALEESGIKYDARLVVRGDFKELDSYLALKNLLESVRLKPTAVFAGNDIMASGAMRAAKDLSLKIPEDFSVIGMDDIAGSETFEPPLTTVKYPVYAMGSAGALKVMEKLESNNKNFKKEKLSRGCHAEKSQDNIHLMDVALVVRKSVSVFKSPGKIFRHKKT